MVKSLQGEVKKINDVGLTKSKVHILDLKINQFIHFNPFDTELLQRTLPIIVLTYTKAVCRVKRVDANINIQVWRHLSLSKCMYSRSAL